MKKALTIPLYIIGFILLGLFSGYMAFKLLSFSRTVEVPDLKGKTVVEANDLLTRKGLYLKVEGEDYDPVIVPGRVARQDVPPGNQVKEQRGIKVVLSRGQKVWSIPQVSGMSLEEAEQTVAGSGLRVEKVIRLHSDVVEKDRIIAQKPNPDEALGAGAPQSPQDLIGQRHGFSLIVSAGPYIRFYSCPDFSGKSKDEALSLARRLNLDVETTGSGEKVKSQKPKPNTIVKSGEKLHLQLEGERVLP
ncbi:MAG TPA: PASTA domain-containing protein [Thermodesulfovibrionales bacterium]|nr:PASTA domain-containing protein [Thermodesulfovibrionales bacterium]